ncbi:MAG TPA: hypothetical protein VE621_00490 [Bryobacteraceae bacterium]|nr:hypothetical protein [Bryobacteraceae bacterium]
MQRLRATESALEAYLASFDRARRDKLRRTLDNLALSLSHGERDATAFPWSKLQPQDLRDPSRFTQTLSPADLRRSKRALNGLLRQIWLIGEIETDQYHELTSVSWMRTTTSIGPRRRATSDTIEALLLSCRSDESANGIRDYALISLLSSGACNASELIRVDLDSYLPDTGQLKMTPGSTPVTLSKQTVEAIELWLTVRGHVPGPLLCGLARKADVMPLRPLTASAITWILRKRAHQAGMPYLSSEDLRRSSILDRYFAPPPAGS